MRDEAVAPEEVAQGMSGGFGDANARGDLDGVGAKAIVGDPEAGSRRGEIAAIVASPGNAEGLSQAAGAGGELWEIARAVEGYAASAGHLFDSLDRLDGAKENTAGFAFRFTGNIEAIVITVDEIDVGKTGRAEENGIARGATRSGVGGRIILSEISLDFDDAGGKGCVFAGADEKFAEKIAGDAARGTGEEGAREGLGIRRHGTSLAEMLQARGGIMESGSERCTRDPRSTRSLRSLAQGRLSPRW